MSILVLPVLLLSASAWVNATDTEKSNEAPLAEPNAELEQTSTTKELEQWIEQRRQRMRKEIEKVKEQNDHRTSKDPPSVKSNVEAKGCPKSAPKHDSPIRISNASLSNAGWNLMLDSADELTELEARPVGHSIWVPAQAYDQTFSATFAELPDCASIEVRATTADGRELGPYTLMFDAVKSARKQAMESLRMTPGAWVYVRSYPDADHTIVYFTHLATYRCGLHEVRYSIDNEKLDKRWSLPACSLDDPFSVPRDAEIDISLPERHEFVAVQLVYADESVSDVVIQRRKKQ